MGLTISNLDELIQISSGCGEQNMINFAPNVYVVDYLQTTGQGRADVIEQAKNIMTRGINSVLTV